MERKVWPCHILSCFLSAVLIALAQPLAWANVSFRFSFLSLPFVILAALRGVSCSLPLYSNPSAQPSIAPGREAVVSICLGWARLLFINISAYPTGTLPSSLTPHPVCSLLLFLFFPSRLFVLYLFCLPIPQLDNSIPFRYYYLPVPRPRLINLWRKQKKIFFPSLPSVVGLMFRQLTS